MNSTAFRTQQAIVSLSVWDYVVFGLFLGISTAIGLYFMVQEKKKKKNNAEEYLFAGKQMTAIPVSMSLTASFMSALTMLGWPSEFYLYGTMFSWFMLCYILVGLLTAFVFIPLFYDAGVNSTYEFLDKRYNSPTLRVIMELVYLVNTALYLRGTNFFLVNNMRLNSMKNLSAHRFLIKKN